ncbi:MAG: hydroxyacylglutathione hydrolase [Oceanicoccus sp.]|jgi:hydroxyacylglutathione hydrolase
MKYLTAMLLAMIIVTVVACGADEVATDIQADELMARIFNNNAPLILDVRSVAEYQQGHVPTAVHLPFSNHRKLLSEMQLSTDQEIILYCEKGPRAIKVVNYLQQQGFFELRQLTGHMSAWREAGLQLSTD